MRELRFAALLLIPFLFSTCKKESQLSPSAFNLTASANKAMRISFTITRQTTPTSGIVVETVELFGITQPYEYTSAKAQKGDVVSAEVSIDGLGTIDARVRSLGLSKSTSDSYATVKGRSYKKWSFTIE